MGLGGSPVLTAGLGNAQKSEIDKISSDLFPSQSQRVEIPLSVTAFLRALLPALTPQHPGLTLSRGIKWKSSSEALSVPPWPLSPCRR